MRRIFSPSVLGVAVLAAATYALVYDSYQIDLAVRVLLAAFVAIGLRMLVGLAGQLSLGHAGFFAIGAYGSAILSTRTGMSPLIALALSALASWVIAVALGWAVLRLRGLYLGMATLGFGTIVFVIVNTETDWTGGPDGMTVPPLSAFGQVLEGKTLWYIVASLLVLAVMVLSENIQRSPYGQAVQAMQASESAAASCAINVSRIKIQIFALSAAIASVGGSLLAHFSGYITPYVSSFVMSVEFLAMVIIGGSLSVLGPLVGAIVITTLPIALGAAPEGVETMVFGLVLMVALITMPQGMEVPIRKLLSRRSR
ncbi:MAG: branched-chain amino acid ABC transporter permease [Burkholderiaceae bacterium]|nr:branched-chain amino acid ABC transporter permease [Burkholderiaceae bacterium]